MVGQPFGAWLASELAGRGESRRSFARRVGVTDMTVTGWIRGAQPSWENCQRIAAALGIEPAAVRQLAGYDHDPSESVPGLPRDLTEQELEVIRRVIGELRTAS
jgi:transcriptional regulator with XRE-family HTH domain